jgi:hypothetical protein
MSALARVGRRAGTRELFANMLARRNAAGLLSEDLRHEHRRDLGQPARRAYSMVGLM